MIDESKLEYKEHLNTLEEEKQDIIKCFAEIVNCNCRENISNTPDFIIAEYLYDCLVSYEKIHNANEKWYGKKLEILHDTTEAV